MIVFDFQKLEVYKKAKRFDAELEAFVENTRLPRYKADQLCRTAFSVVLNIGEGSGRFSKADRRRFFVMARSSIFECAAALDMLHDSKHLNQTDLKKFYSMADELSRMLYGMIRNLST